MYSEEVRYQTITIGEMSVWNLIDEKNSGIKNIRRVYPLKQAFVGDLVRITQHFPEITRVIIFGSSVTELCNPWSGVDMYLEGVAHCPVEYYSMIPDRWNQQALDIWTSDMADETLLPEINKNGVTVYEKAR